MRLVLGIILCAALAAGQTISAFNQLCNEIRDNRLAGINPISARLTNPLGWTPLHYAALYGSVDAMRHLLEAKADPNAKDNTGATPLVYAAWEFKRAKLLVDYGASVQVADKEGLSPLTVASTVQGNLPTVQLLLSHGADVKISTSFGDCPLARAAGYSDSAVVQALLAHGADPVKRDKAGFSPLMDAIAANDVQSIRVLLQAGSDPNVANTMAGRVKNGPLALVHLTPLMLAAPYASTSVVNLLLQAGARVNETDSRKMTALMFAIATDAAKPQTVAALLAAGADPKLVDAGGDTALDWARKYKNPAIVRLLEDAHTPSQSAASPTPATTDAGAGSAHQAVERASALLARSDFFRAGGGCAGCHHQPMYGRVYAAAQHGNYNPDAALGHLFRDALTANRPRYMRVVPTLSSLGGDFDGPLSVMVADAELGEPASALTDSLVHFLAARQGANGAWESFGIARPPLEDSSITRTAYAIAALKQYAFPSREDEFKIRIAKARQWLVNAKPNTIYEQAEQIWGLYNAGMSSNELKLKGDRLLQLQGANGGWAQTPYLDADAFATGLVLDALWKTGSLRASDPAYQRGAAYLLRTQFPDGSWFVRSRAVKFQPYFQSGFPFDHDQWISSAGTAWAAIALSHMQPETTLAQR